MGLVNYDQQNFITAHRERARLPITLQWNDLDILLELTLNFMGTAYGV